MGCIFWCISERSGRENRRVCRRARWARWRLLCNWRVRWRCADVTWLIDCYKPKGEPGSVTRDGRQWENDRGWRNTRQPVRDVCCSSAGSARCRKGLHNGYDGWRCNTVCGSVFSLAIRQVFSITSQLSLAATIHNTLSHSRKREEREERDDIATVSCGVRRCLFVVLLLLLTDIFLCIFRHYMQGLAYLRPTASTSNRHLWTSWRTGCSTEAPKQQISWRCG